MHVQHDLSLTVIALMVSYLIGRFLISATSMQVAFYIIPTAWKYKRLTSYQLNMNIEKIFKVCERAERASEEIFAFMRSKTHISFNV